MPTLVTKNIRLVNNADHNHWINIQVKKDAIGHWRFHKVISAHGYVSVSAKTIVDLAIYKSHVLLRNLRVYATEIDQAADDVSKTNILQKSEAIMRKRDILTNLKDDLLKQGSGLIELHTLWISPHVQHYS